MLSTLKLPYLYGIVELAPRIKALSQKKEELLQAKADAEELLRYKSVNMADRQVVKDYADDLRSLLAKSSVTEQRSFLKSFVNTFALGRL